jgi:hypothetical protein
VSATIATLPNKRKLTSTPSDDELGLYPSWTRKILPRVTPARLTRKSLQMLRTDTITSPEITLNSVTPNTTAEHR